jgi:phosphate transport system permease protein
MRARKVANWAGLCLLAALGAAAVVPLFALLADVYVRGVQAIAQLGGLIHFLTAPPPSPHETTGGIGPLLAGSLFMTALGALLGIAVGLPLGVYIGEFGRERLAGIARVGVMMFVEIPTVIVGLFVYALASFVVRDLNEYVLKPLSSALSAVLGGWTLWFVGPLDMFNAYAGALALALVMVPYVALVTASAYASVGQPLREAAYSIGVREFNAIFVVLRKAVSRAVITAALLGTAKIAGETAPLLFTAFGNVNYAPLTGPTGAVTLWVYYAAQTPYEALVMSAYGASAALLTVILIVFIAARVRE